MANKLRKMQLTSVDLVRAGANQEADIRLYKSAYPQEGTEMPSEREKNIFKRFTRWLRENSSDGQYEPSDLIQKDYTSFENFQNNREKHEKLWDYNSALTESIRSIMDDKELNKDEKEKLMNESLNQFNKAMKELFSSLCTVGSDCPKIIKNSDSDRYDVIEEVKKNEISEIEKFNPYHGKDGRFASATGGGGISAAGSAVASDFGNSDTGTFASAVATARESCAEKDRWRVTAHTKEELESDYQGAKLHVTKGGSTVAVTTDGDIISVCKNQSDTARGRDLMQMAVENGGTKLDSFSGNHDFYTKCGFEPVSWTPFNETYAPDGWRKGIDKPEPIIFYKHTGKQSTIKAEEFMSKTKPFTGESGYDEAMKFRNDSMEG